MARCVVGAGAAAGAGAGSGSSQWLAGVVLGEVLVWARGGGSSTVQRRLWAAWARRLRTLRGFSWKKLPPLLRRQSFEAEGMVA